MATIISIDRDLYQDIRVEVSRDYSNGMPVDPCATIVEDVPEYDDSNSVIGVKYKAGEIITLLPEEYDTAIVALERDEEEAAAERMLDY